MEVYERRHNRNLSPGDHTEGLFLKKPKIVALMLVITLLSLGLLLWVKNITIKVDGKTMKIYTWASDVDQALRNKGIKTDKEDLVKPSLNTLLRHGTVIEIKRAVPVEIKINGISKRFKTAQMNIEDFLKSEKLNVAPADKVIPDTSCPISPNMKITIIRVSTISEVKEVDIPYNVEKKADNNIEMGFSKVVQNGEKGLEKQVFKITYEDGKEVNKEIVGKETIRAPKNQIVAMGNLREVSRGGQNLRFKSSSIMTATGYTHTGHRTATGTNPHRGVVAVDPSVIPLGSRIYVENYGYAIAEDTGGAIKGNIIDLFYETKGEADRWGRRSVKVYILE